MALYIKSLAHHVPSKRLTNGDLEKMVDTSDEWIVARTGIRERPLPKRAGDLGLGFASGQSGLEKRGLSASDLDAVVAATCTPDTTMPGASSHIQAGLGPTGMCFDLNAACSGFVYGMEVAEGLLSSGNYKNILLASADKFSSTVNYKDRNTCILFGDGGCAVLSSEPVGPEVGGVLPPVEMAP